MVSSSSTQLDVKKDVLNAHRTLINVMQSLPDLAFVSSGNVTVISLDHLLIRHFAPLIKTGPGIVNLWFSNSLLGNIYVQGMLIYRMDVQV